MAILPQGIDKSDFGDLSGNFDAYTDDALGILYPHDDLTKLRIRIVLSSHSGGGSTVAKILEGCDKIRFPLFGIMTFDSEGYDT
jgi:hypothetical protein